MEPTRENEINEVTTNLSGEQRELFERWACSVCALLFDPVTGYEEARTRLLSEEALLPAPWPGKKSKDPEMPGFYDPYVLEPEELRQRGESLAYALFEPAWRREAAEDDILDVHTSSYPHDNSFAATGIIEPKKGDLQNPLGRILFRARDLAFSDLACETEADLIEVWRLVLASGFASGWPTEAPPVEKLRCPECGNGGAEGAAVKLLQTVDLSGDGTFKGINEDLDYDLAGDLTRGDLEGTAHGVECYGCGHDLGPVVRFVHKNHEGLPGGSVLRE